MKIISSQWIAFRIWVLAVILNTLLGTVYLTDFLTNTGWWPAIAYYGTLYGFMFSFPVFLTLLFIMNRCVAKKVNGSFIFRVTLIAGIVLAIVVSVVFSVCFGPGDQPAFLIIAILSAVISISAFKRSLSGLSIGTNALENIPYTNQNSEL